MHRTRINPFQPEVGGHRRRHPHGHVAIDWHPIARLCPNDIGAGRQRLGYVNPILARDGEPFGIGRR